MSIENPEPEKGDRVARRHFCRPFRALVVIDSGPGPPGPGYYRRGPSGRWPSPSPLPFAVPWKLDLDIGFGYWILDIESVR